MQLMMAKLGGDVRPAAGREYGRAVVKVEVAMRSSSAGSPPS
jgi:GMP synthase-like glutamine amidotransferase